ncbi:MAG: methyltransferase domain-containing protein [Rhizobiaceae bacterium]
MSDPCPLCGGIERPVVSSKDRHGNALTTVICKDCGVVTNDPIPSDEELAAFYRQDYRKQYKGLAEPRMRQVWRNFRGTAEHIRAFHDYYDGRQRCLDLGAGSGEFMYLAGRIGIDCLGVEPNEGYSAYCRDKLGLNVLSQTLEESDFAEGSFDLIRLSHVMEHMRDPVRSLKVLKRWLSDDGVLYIEVPNIDRDATHKMRGKIFHFGHIFNFSPWTMRMTALLAGLEEDPESAKRNGGMTAGFFRKAVISSSPRDIINRPKAQFTHTALMDHYRRSVPQPEEGSAVGRAVSTVHLRLSEMLAARKFGGPGEIADHFAAHLSASLTR